MARNRSGLRLFDPGAAQRPPPCAGFTLLELLVTVGILVILAGGVVLSLEGSREAAAAGIAQRELSELHAAVLRFRRDTGHLPRRGPFALVADGGQLDPDVDAHWPPGAPSGSADRAAWFRSPANFYQLGEDRDAPSFQVALDVVAGPGLVFNPETRRGYLGPYLSRHGEGFVHVGKGLGTNGDGDPATGSLVEVPGVADPFEAPPAPSNIFHWTGATIAASSSPLGRPYLLFVVAPAPGELGPRIVCLGPNGAYDSDEGGLGGDDLAVFLGN